MANNLNPTAFTEVWALAQDKLDSLERLKPVEIGFTEAFMEDSINQRFLSQTTIAQIARESKARDGVGSEPLVSIPFINKETGTLAPTGSSLCDLRANRSQVSSVKKFNPTGFVQTSMTLDPQEYIDQGVSMQESVEASIIDAENEIWDTTESTLLTVVEANKNQAWTGIKLPAGWAVVADAVQIPYADINLIPLWIPKIFKQMRMTGPYHVTTDMILSGYFTNAANQGAGNAVNTQYQFNDNVLTFRTSQAIDDITPPLGVSHVFYAVQKNTSVMFSRVPSVYKTPLNRNINGEFDVDAEINGMPIMLGATPYEWGMKTLTVCNATNYHENGVGAGVDVRGTVIQERIFESYLYGIIQPVSDPATIKSPVIRFEVLDAV